MDQDLSIKVWSQVPIPAGPGHLPACQAWPPAQDMQPAPSQVQDVSDQTFLTDQPDRGKAGWKEQEVCTNPRNVHG